MMKEQEGQKLFLILTIIVNKTDLNSEIELQFSF